MADPTHQLANHACMQLEAVLNLLQREIASHLNDEEDWAHLALVHRAVELHGQLYAYVADSGATDGGVMAQIILGAVERVARGPAYAAAS